MTTAALRVLGAELEWLRDARDRLMVEWKPLPAPQEPFRLVLRQLNREIRETRDAIEWVEVSDDGDDEARLGAAPPFDQGGEVATFGPGGWVGA